MFTPVFTVGCKITTIIIQNSVGTWAAGIFEMSLSVPAKDTEAVSIMQSEPQQCFLQTVRHFILYLKDECRTEQGIKRPIKSVMPC